MWIPLLTAALQATLQPALPTAASPFVALAVYDGTWSVASPKTMAGPGKDDRVVNRCSAGTAFFACEQVVNGKSMALLVFTLGDSPGHFHSSPILPDGHAVGRGDLTIDGPHWTFLGKSISDDGKSTTWYRTENFFTGNDRIHFEQFESTDGTTWKQTNAGDERRQAKP